MVLDEKGVDWGKCREKCGLMGLPGKEVKGFLIKNNGVENQSERSKIAGFRPSPETDFNKQA